MRVVPNLGLIRSVAHLHLLKLDSHRTAGGGPYGEVANCRFGEVQFIEHGFGGQTYFGKSRLAAQVTYSPNEESAIRHNFALTCGYCLPIADRHEPTTERWH